jgi:hypothetical protein
VCVLPATRVHTDFEVVADNGDAGGLLGVNGGLVQKEEGGARRKRQRRGATATNALSFIGD